MGSKKERISRAPVKGMRDVFPNDMAVRNWLFSEWKAVSHLFGFEEYDSAIVESEELYVRKAGDDSPLLCVVGAPRIDARRASAASARRVQRTSGLLSSSVPNTVSSS